MPPSPGGHKQIVTPDPLRRMKKQYAASARAAPGRGGTAISTTKMAANRLARTT